MKLSSIRTFRPNKTWIVLGVALGIGLLAALVAKSYLANKMAEINAQSTANMVDYVVAKSDLPKDAALTADDVAVRPIPKTYAPATGIRPGEFAQIDGQKLAYGVRSGEVILWGLLKSKKAPTFSAQIAVGRRAMTVPVDQINSISGLLDPGDRIDLMVTVDHNNQKITFPLLQDVQVMATGREAADDAKDGRSRTYDTVTLNVTPQEASNLIIARAAGKITALLRNPEDQTKIGNSPADLALLLGQTRGGGSVASDQQIPVLYGGAQKGFSAADLTLGQYANARLAEPPDPLAKPTSGPSLAVRAPFAPVVPIVNNSVP